MPVYNSPIQFITMSFEQNLRSYLAFFDGTKRDFSEVEHLFDAIYAADYIQLDGSTLNKGEMKTLHTNCLYLGSKASVIQINNVAPNSVEFEFRMVSDKFDVTIHSLGEIKNGKLVKDKRVAIKKDSLGSMLKARAYLLDFYDVERKYRDHLGVYDGTVKSDDNMVLFANRATDTKTRSRGTVRNGKVVRIESYADANTTVKNIRNVVELSDLNRNMHTYERVLNSDQSTLQDIQNAIDSIFHSELTADIEGSTMGKSELKEQIFRDFAENAKIHFEKMEVIDESHIEIIIRKENDWRRHQVLTVKDAKIARIETVTDVGDLVYHLNEYIRVQNSDRSTFQDMEMVFEKIFHDDLVSNIVEYGSEDGKRIIFKDFIERAKLAFEKVEVIDESHIEIIISKENDWRRHQILTVKDGKIVRAETMLEGKAAATNIEYLKSLSRIASQ